MGWTAPGTWTETTPIYTETDLNAQIRDNLAYLKARGVVPTLEAKLSLPDKGISPVGAVILKVIDAVLWIRNAADGAYAKIATASVPTGTGVTQVSLGSHTHAPSLDTSATVASSLATDTYPVTDYSHTDTIAASATSDVATATISFATARAYGLAAIRGEAATANTLKVQLIMGGTLIAEDGYMSTSCSLITVSGTGALSGSQSCICRVKNYDSGSSRSWYSDGYPSASEVVAFVAAGSATTGGAV